MGYRSEVGIALYNKDYKTMVKRAKNLKDSSIYKLINYADKYTADGGKIIILYFSDVKWYTDFKEVIWIENFIQKVKSAFIRMGEELNDNEEICYNEGYNLFDYCRFTRVIDIDGNKQEDDENLNELLDDIDRRL